MSNRSPSPRRSRRTRKSPNNRARSPVNRKYSPSDTHKPGVKDEIECPYPKYKYSCGLGNKWCVTKPDYCLKRSADIPDDPAFKKRAAPQWSSPRKRTPTRRLSPVRYHMTSVVPAAAYAKTVKRAISPSFARKIAKAASPLRNVETTYKRRTSNSYGKRNSSRSATRPIKIAPVPSRRTPKRPSSRRLSSHRVQKHKTLHKSIVSRRLSHLRQLNTK